MTPKQLHILQHALGVDKGYGEIILTKGQVAIVDLCKFEEVNQFKWYAWWNKSTRTFYAARTARINGKKVCIYMHRYILGLPTGDKRLGDHRNPSKTLDNRLENLRITDRVGNGGNSRFSKNNTSGYKGVYWNKEKRKWSAQIMVNRKHINLGYFANIKDGYEAYCRAAVKNFGEFARFK